MRYRIVCRCDRSLCCTLSPPHLPKHSSRFSPYRKNNVYASGHKQVGGNLRLLRNVPKKAADGRIKALERYRKDGKPLRCKQCVAADEQTERENAAKRKVVDDNSDETEDVLASVNECCRRHRSTEIDLRLSLCRPTSRSMLDVCMVDLSMTHDAVFTTHLNFPPLSTQPQR